jgi:hypothetical protein
VDNDLNNQVIACYLRQSHTSETSVHFFQH